MNLNSIHLSKKESSILNRLDTPIKIQNFIDSIPTNFEQEGETNKSPRRTLRENKAHCLEGALLAALALWMHGHKPLIMDMKSTDDDVDHVIAPFKINGYWGCISKTNHATIRYRDPVYKTIRELAMSYFHEWFMNKDGRKTLRSYSNPYDLRKFKGDWVTASHDLWEISELLDSLKHFKVAPEKNIQLLRIADPMERKAGNIEEWGRDGERLS